MIIIRNYSTVFLRCDQTGCGTERELTLSDDLPERVIEAARSHGWHVSGPGLATRCPRHRR